MGVLNATPDSFSDGGHLPDPHAAVAAGLAMVAAGASILDVGGESTRPGSGPVPPDLEQARVLPVVRALADAGACVSVDTRNAATMAAALDAGAAIVNDVSGLTHDPSAAPLIASRGCPVILMHMRGTPATMNAHAHYDDVLAEVSSELRSRAAAAEAAGIRAERIALDPGIGFAKDAGHCVVLLRQLRQIAALGYPVVAGVSRKSFIGQLTGEADAAARDPGSVAAGLFAVLHGARILRVHNVSMTMQALRVWRALAA